MIKTKSDFTRGIIWGIILTFIGSILQFYLFTKYESRKEHISITNSTCRFLDKRLHRSIAIRNSSRSTTFDDRWNNYIHEVIYPWNENLFLIDNSIASFYNKQVHTEFETICQEFKSLHRLLNDIRKKQGTKSESGRNALKENEKHADLLISSLKSKIKKLKARLIN